MLHLVDRLISLHGSELAETPFAQHLRVQKVLIDRGQLVLQHPVEVLDDLLVRRTHSPPSDGGAIPLGGAAIAMENHFHLEFASFATTRRTETDVYVCLCRAVTDKDIKRAVDAGHRDVVQVREQTGMGTGCGRCREFGAALVRELTNTAEPLLQAACLDVPRFEAA